MELLTGIIGYTASILSTIAFIPQAYYVVKTNDTQSISLPTYTIFFISVVFWFTYGVLLKDFPLMAANLVCVIMGGTILLYKVKEIIKAKKNQ